MIVKQVEIEGCGKGANGWFDVRPPPAPPPPPPNARLDHALNLDFVNEAQGPGARVAVELSAESARTLMEAIQAVLARAEAGGFLETGQR